MAKEQDIIQSDYLLAGEDKSLVFNVTDTSGNPQTMTGWTLEFVIRRYTAQPTADLSKTTTGGAIAISNGSGTNDRATVTIAAADTLGMTPALYNYALHRTDSGGAQVLAYGTLLLQQAASR